MLVFASLTLAAIPNIKKSLMSVGLVSGTPHACQDLYISRKKHLTFRFSTILSIRWEQPRHLYKYHNDPVLFSYTVIAVL